MNTNYLITLKTILEAGSFQKGALKLNYTQSTITYQVKQLEQELSIKLFEKIGRKMILTQAGNDILPFIKTILQATEQINNYGKGISEMNGSLRVVVPDSLLIYLLQPVIQVFRQKAPNVQLIINAMNCIDIREQLINGSADIGIHCDIGNYPATIALEELGAFRVCMVAPPFVDSKELDFITPHQRKTLNMISSEPHSSYQKVIMEYLTEKDIILNQTMEMWSIDAVKKSVINNLGISYLPIFAVEEELKSGALIQVKTGLDDTLFSSFCSYHKNKWISPPMELFLQLAQKFLGKTCM